MNHKVGIRYEVDLVDNNWGDRIFAFWMGNNNMEPIRKECLRTLSKTECDIILVTLNNLDSWLVPDAPLHPAFEFLSPVHRSDYLRAYFMFHHGGGYSDIKPTSKSWLNSFRRLASSNAVAAGYTIPRGDMPDLRRSRVNDQYYLGKSRSYKPINAAAYWASKVMYKRFIGLGAFIFKPRSSLAANWLGTVENRLDILFPALRQYPAIAPKERGGLDYGFGPSHYPVPWSFLLGDILVPLVARHQRAVLHCVPMPQLENYQSYMEATRGHTGRST